MPWGKLAAIAIMLLPVLGLPPLIYFFHCKPERYVAWNGRREQEGFYYTRMSGKEWTDEVIDAILWRSGYRFALGAPLLGYVRYSAD